MRRINLLTLIIENFRSWRGRQIVELSSEPGFKYLTGENLVSPRLGANGAGKSSFLDAIFWCWYGTSVRGQRAADLVSWGVKRPQVATCLTIDGERFTIERTGSPEAISINGEPVKQAQVDQLLGLSKIRATNALIFGQNAPVFADLGVAARGAILDEVMDLQIWQEAGEQAKARADDLQDLVNGLELELSRLDGRIEALPDAEELRQQAMEWRAQRKERLKQANARLTQEEDRLAACEEAYDGLVDAEEDDGEMRKARKRRGSTEEDLRRLRKQLDDVTGASERAQQLLKRWQNYRTCPACEQPIPEERRKKGIAEAKAAMGDADARIEVIEAEYADANAADAVAKKEMELLLRKQGGKEEARRAAKAALKEQERMVQDIIGIVETLLEQKNPHEAALADADEKRKRWTSEKRKKGAERLDYMGQVEQCLYWMKAFKRVRLFEIGRVLQHLSLEIEAAAVSLGLSGWRIELATESETKTGTVKQGVQILISNADASAPWESWSGGESQRLRLAIAIGFASMIQRMSGVRYTFELWDEPSTWLSEEGIEDLLATLRQRSEAEQLSLWLVDHRALQSVAFDEVWAVRKTQEGSVLVRK